LYKLKSKKTSITTWEYHYLPVILKVLYKGGWGLSLPCRWEKPATDRCNGSDCRVEFGPYHIQNWERLQQVEDENAGTPELILIRSGSRIPANAQLCSDNEPH